MLSGWPKTCLPSARINDLAGYFVLDGQSANTLKDICCGTFCLTDSQSHSCVPCLPLSIDLESSGATTVYQMIEEIAA